MIVIVTFSEIQFYRRRRSSVISESISSITCYGVGGVIRIAAELVFRTISHESLYKASDRLGLDRTDIGIQVVSIGTGTRSCNMCEGQCFDTGTNART